MTHDSNPHPLRYKIVTAVFIVIALVVMLITFFPYGMLGDIIDGTEDYTVAVLLPISGDLAEYGQAYARGAELAAEDINAMGGVRGHKIVLEFLDCADDLNLLKRGFFNAYDRGIPAAIGPLTSSEVHEIAPYAAMYGIVLMSPSATSRDLDQYRDYFYRVVPSDYYLGLCTATVFGSMKGVSNIAVIYADNSYGIGITDAFEEELARSYPDKDIVYRECILDRLPADGKKIAEGLKSTKADAVFVVVTDIDDVLLILKASNEAGIHPIWVGTDYSQTERLSEAGNYSDKFKVCISSIDMTDNDRFKNRYVKKFNTDLNVYKAIYGYDAMNVLAQAMYSGGYDAQEIKLSLDDIRFTGITGAIKFNEFNDRYPSYDIMEYSYATGRWNKLGWGSVIDFEYSGHGEHGEHSGDDELHADYLHAIR